MEVQLDSIQYTHNQMKEVVDGALLKRLYVLNGVSTMEDIVTAAKELIASLHKDCSMRAQMIDALKTAGMNQMGVYVSAWKYSPCIDEKRVSQLEAILEDEVNT